MNDIIYAIPNYFFPVFLHNFERPPKKRARNQENRKSSGTKVIKQTFLPYFPLSSTQLSLFDFFGQFFVNQYLSDNFLEFFQADMWILNWQLQFNTDSFHLKYSSKTVLTTLETSVLKTDLVENGDGRRCQPQVSWCEPGTWTWNSYWTRSNSWVLVMFKLTTEGCIMYFLSQPKSKKNRTGWSYKAYKL